METVVVYKWKCVRCKASPDNTACYKTVLDSNALRDGEYLNLYFRCYSCDKEWMRTIHVDFVDKNVEECLLECCKSIVLKEHIHVCNNKEHWASTLGINKKEFLRQCAWRAGRGALHR
jgi:hypothetical protein